MDNKYIIVRANSTSGAYIVERNECAPRVNTWTKADVAGYARTLRAAEALAHEANERSGDWEAMDSARADDAAEAPVAS